MSVRDCKNPQQLLLSSLSTNKTLHTKDHTKPPLDPPTWPNRHKYKVHSHIQNKRRRINTEFKSHLSPSLPEFVWCISRFLFESHVMASDNINQSLEKKAVPVARQVCNSHACKTVGDYDWVLDSDSTAVLTPDVSHKGQGNTNIYKLQIAQVVRNDEMMLIHKATCLTWRDRSQVRRKHITPRTAHCNKKWMHNREWKWNTRSFVSYANVSWNLIHENSPGLWPRAC